MATTTASGVHNEQFSTMFHILRNKRRRVVIQHLAEVSPQTTVDTLADYVARVETGKVSVSGAERKRVYISLYQAHLDKMDKEGVIQYDKREGRIERGPEFTDYWGMIAPGDGDDDGGWLDRIAFWR